jgi:alkaline phosphatase D
MTITRRDFALGTALLPVAACASSALVSASSAVDVVTLNISEPVLRLAFGSCLHQDKPQAFWEVIAAHSPHAFVCLGDNIYPNKTDAEFDSDAAAILAAYKKQTARADFSAFRKKVPFLGIWDDNDYGESDAGIHYPYKDFSRQLFLDFLGEPQISRRRTQSGGLYVAYEFGPPGRTCQLILPDLRFSRTDWRRAGSAAQLALAQSGFGPYLPDGSPTASLLGAEQWTWLERIFERQADVRLIGSSIQALSASRGWEAWSNFPAEQRRLIDLIDRSAGETLILSGDAHFAEVSSLIAPSGRALFDITSSGLTESWPDPGPNANRWNDAVFTGTNFGLVHVNFVSETPVVVAELRTTDGDPLFQTVLK